MASYAAPLDESRAEIREKGSRFLAVIGPAMDEAAARAALGTLEREFPDATHHCWAWRLGSPARERSSDAGEPAGTAGIPMLQVLRGAGLSDVLAVVVRWFGGTKLGKGGLARAYAAAAREALAALPVLEHVPMVEIAPTFVHPIFQKDVTTLLSESTDTSSVVRWNPFDVNSSCGNPNH